MKYGYFDDERREYVINTPKTPKPWINYLGHKDFFSLISNTGGGYCFYRDAKLRRLTRYRYNSIPRDNGGRYFYVKEDENIFSLTWMPVQSSYDFYECRHGLGYTIIKTSHKKLDSEVLFMVPNEDNVEIHKVSLKNADNVVKKIKLYSYIEFCLWNAYDDMTNYQRTLNIGAVETRENVIYHKTDYRERRNHYSFYSVNENISGFETERDSFLGEYNGLNNPRAVEEGKVINSIAVGGNPIASHELEIELQPGEVKELVFLLGYVENEEDEKWEKEGIINKKKAEILIEKYNTSEKVNTAFEELKKYWEKLLSIYSVKTPEDKTDRMVNIWNQYQCMVTFNLSRSASYYETGIGRGMGFRDSNQDILGFVHMIPEKARERILDLASTQLEDGGAYHQYQPLTKKGNNEIGGGFNDDPLWLILSTVSYIKETGDFSILKEEITFNCDETKKETLLNHLERSFNYTLNNLGPHGLPLIGRADWNDCLNLNCFSRNPDESFQTCGNKVGGRAESIFIAGMFVYIGKEYEGLLKAIGNSTEAEKVHRHIKDMEESVKKYGFDGSWFLRAYDFYGNKIGSHENEEGKIFIESQGFCSMAEIGLEEGLVISALNSVKENLSTDYGLILQTPAYSKYDIKLGEISSYPPGLKENAGVFCHNNPWIIIGETKIGRGEEAFEYYKKIAPAYVEEISHIHKLEPYVYAQMVAGRDALNHGEAKNSWLTGTASWNFEAISKWILGIRPEYDGLIVDPCIPRKWKSFKVRRIFRGAIYNIEVLNPKGVSKGIKEIYVDRIKINGNLVPLFNDKGEHSIEVIMGTM